MSETIHQEITIEASPAAVYKALTDGEEFAKFTGAPSEINGEAGAAFSCFGGKIEGRFVELSPGRRVVQAWRPDGWDDGVYTLVRFELAGDGDRTTIVFDQSGIPAAAHSHLEGGWEKMYWEPLRKYFA